MTYRPSPLQPDYITERHCTCECLGACEPDEHRDYCVLHPSQYDAEDIEDMIAERNWRSAGAWGR